MRTATFVLVLGVFLTLPCVLMCALFTKNYFELAFPARRPRFLEERSLSDAIVAYYLTRLFLILVLGLSAIYLVNVIRNAV